MTIIQRIQRQYNDLMDEASKKGNNLDQESQRYFKAITEQAENGNSELMSPPNGLLDKIGAISKIKSEIWAKQSEVIMEVNRVFHEEPQENKVVKIKELSLESNKYYAKTRQFILGL